MFGPKNGPPHLRVTKRQVAVFMMHGGAYGMIFDALIRVSAAMISIELLHQLHELAANYIGPQGAAFAGLGALLEMYVRD